MTNEEAIQTLKEDRELYEGDIVEAGDGTPDGQLMLALDMAIEALEKQEARKKLPPTYTTTGKSLISACVGRKLKKIRHTVMFAGR